jgi:hypothetical protein
MVPADPTVVEPEVARVFTPDGEVVDLDREFPRHEISGLDEFDTHALPPRRVPVVPRTGLDDTSRSPVRAAILEPSSSSACVRSIG